jgi:hypothetical protein
VVLASVLASKEIGNTQGLLYVQLWKGLCRVITDISLNINFLEGSICVPLLNNLKRKEKEGFNSFLFFHVFWMHIGNQVIKESAHCWYFP